jgi:hypothetical protein
VGVAKGDSSPYVLFYNKDMLENEGLEDPRELAANGEWTWDKFKEMCLVVTGDTDYDGVDDRWGYTGWYPYDWLGTNHTSILKFDGSAQFSLNIDDPAVFETMQFLQSMYGVGGDKKWYNTVGNNIVTSFLQGSNAFLNEYSWTMQEIDRAKERGEFSFEVGVVGMPYGPSNTEKFHQIHAGGFSIITGSDNPYTAGAWMDVLMEMISDPSNTTYTPPEDLKALTAELLQKPYSHALADSAANQGRALVDAVTLAGSDISQAIESVRNTYQMMVDDVNKPVEFPERRPFTPMSLTFDADAQGIIKYDHPDQADLDYGVEWVADGIDGGSLLLKTSLETNGTWCDIAITDPAVYDVVGWQNYKISFDYRVDTIPEPENSRYELKLINQEAGNFAVVRVVPEAPGEVGHAELDYAAANTNSKTISLMFTAYRADSILIDNLKIEPVDEF